MVAAVACGVSDFRIEPLDVDHETIDRTIALNRDLLARRIAGKEVWRHLAAANRVGVTRGTIEERNPLAII